MRVWHFTEQSYEPGWSKTDGYIRIEMPSELCDPATASDLLNRFLDEWIACRRTWPRHHGQRAPHDHVMHVHLMHAANGSVGATNQEGATADARHSDRASTGPVPRRRGNRARRLAVARPARGGLRARRSLRGVQLQPQSGGSWPTVLGSARFDHESAYSSGRTVPVGGRILSVSSRQCLASRLPATAPTDLGANANHQQQPESGRPRLCLCLVLRRRRRKADVRILP